MDADAGVLIAAALLVLCAPAVTIATRWMDPVALAMLVAAGLLAGTGWRQSKVRAQRSLGAVTKPLVIATLATQGAAQLAVLVGSSSPAVRVLVIGAYVLAAGAAVAVGHLKPVPGITPVRLFIVGQAVVFGLLLQGYTHRIDVWVFLNDGVHALLHGTNPYAITFPNIYPAKLVATFYGHGVVVDGRVTYGFPYPPVMLLLAAPGYLLGDVRFAAILALGALAWLMSGPLGDRRSRALGVLLVVAPCTAAVVTRAWTEPMLVALLGLAVWAMKTRRLTVAAVALGLFLVSKQYLVVALPCLWLLRPFATRRTMALVAGSAAAVTVPFVVANPHAFWRSVVEWQLRQPFRRDSLSLLVATVNHFHWPGPTVYNTLPVVAGLVVAIVFSLRARPGPAAFATGVALSVLATVLLSKQAFMNYYFFVGGALLVATWTASVPDTTVPAPRRYEDTPHGVARAGDTVRASPTLS